MWVSTSADLLVDAKRDLDELGATDIPIFPLSKTRADTCGP